MGGESERERQIRALEFFEHLYDNRREYVPARHVEILSPAIPGRTEQAVVLFGYCSKLSASVFLVRNKGRYSAKKSKELAAKLSALLEECELSQANHCEAYERDGKHYYDIEGDEHGTWLTCEEHNTAARKLAKLKNEKQKQDEKTSNKKKPKARKGK